MSIRLTMIAVVLAVLSVIAAMLIVPSSSAGGTVVAQRKLIAPGVLVIDQVQAIELTRRDDKTLRFEQNGQAWQQVAPITYPMDPFSIRQLIVQATEADVIGEIEMASSDVSAAALGLDPPIATLTYEMPGQRIAIKLGRRGLGGRAYAQVEGSDAILIIKSELHDRAVAMEPKEWRARTLFTNVSVDAVRIAFQAGNVTLELRKDRKQWVMDQPVATRVDPLKIEDYVANLAKAQLNGFILDNPDSLDRFGLDPAVGELEVVAAQGEPPQRLRLGLAIGSTTGDRFAFVEGRPAVVRVNKATVDALFPAPEMLIDPTGSGVLPADVKTVTIRAGDSELVFVRDLERWRCASQGNVEVNAALVDDLLRNLTELRAPRVSIEPYPMEKQVALVTFSGFGDKPIDTVRIVKDDANGQWGLENGDNVLRIFPASLKLRLNLEDYGLSGFTP